MPDAAAQLLSPRAQSYRGRITDPDLWDGFAPRRGDVILATPAKSGTTWAQSMIAMLLRGTTDLPDVLGRVSPWIDATFQPAAETQALLDRQTGRRVIKTHTPLDGWPVWDGVHVVVVFRHPMEVFLSSRKHLQNRRGLDSHPMLESQSDALDFYLETPFSPDEVDRDTLATIVAHFEATQLGRWPGALMLNYAAMSRDHAGTIARLDAHLGAGASPELRERIRQATEFGAMKSRAAEFAPEVSNNLWHDERAFFASGRSGGWQDQFTEAQIARYDARFADLLPDPRLRRWIETGQGDV
ncbi:sulfotransferase domain-containing protein [Silicimonas sp. MF1-12-2]|uniref:sulfotransferase domain-containing protein n=1 Tax=Silicimonas sp. MF1-12-2 TaxID=3384793 RepID=UPI0039B3B8F5